MKAGMNTKQSFATVEAVVKTSNQNPNLFPIILEAEIDRYLATNPRL
jgi:hypothetical protein